jgi:two-component system phosphate regulon sensor histidine kinase PhoR
MAGRETIGATRTGEGWLMDSILGRSLALLAGVALAALALGWLFGAAYGWMLLCLVLFGLLVHHLRHLDLLRRWAERDALEVPEGRGVWDEVFALLYRRRRSEARQHMKLARALAMSQQVGRALPYGVAVLDEENRIVWCNDSCERHFGLERERDTGRPITHLVRDPEFVEYVAGKNRAGPLQLRSAQGAGLILSIQLVPYGESQTLLLSQDATQAVKLETMRRDFIANVSHELRTPLTVLIGFLETLRELRLDPERSRDYLDLMAEQGRRMQRIVDDLLTLSSLESAPEPPRDQHIAIRALLERVRDEAVALSGGQHSITLQADEGFDLLGAENEIASAFGNLATNAVRYTPPGGTVRLAWCATPQGAAFSVEDNGIGIAPEHIPRLTERFYRVDRGRSRETGGTGLGLAIVKHVLMRHQATLEIWSEPGQGSRFIVRFPAQRLVRGQGCASDAIASSSALRPEQEK